MPEGLFVYAVRTVKSIVRQTSYVFYQHCDNMNVGGVNYKICGMLESL